MKVVKVSCAGINSMGLLQIILIVLKIIGYNLSWWIVFIPTFIYVGLIIVLLIIIFVTALWGKKLK